MIREKRAAGDYRMQACFQEKAVFPQWTHFKTQWASWSSTLIFPK